jgi:hypothetical protein
MDYLEADSHVLFWMGVFFDGHGIFFEEMSEEINYYNFLLTMIQFKSRKYMSGIKKLMFWVFCLYSLLSCSNIIPKSDLSYQKINLLRKEKKIQSIKKSKKLDWNARPGYKLQPDYARRSKPRILSFIYLV